MGVRWEGDRGEHPGRWHLDGRAGRVPEGAGDAEVPRDVGRLEEGRGPRPLGDDHSRGEAGLHVAARGVEVLGGHLDVAELFLHLPAEWANVSQTQARRSARSWSEGARGRARTKTRRDVTTEKNRPKPRTMPLHGRSAHVRMGTWCRGRRASAQPRAERHHAAGGVRHVLRFAGERVVAPWHRRGPVDRERVEVGETKLSDQVIVVRGV